MHVATDLPGAGFVEDLDLQNDGLNDTTWTPYTYNYTGVTGGDAFLIRFNLASGAFEGAGGTLLVDNVVLAPTGQ